MHIIIIIIVSPSGHPPTLSDRRSSDSYLSFVLRPPCEALVVGLELRSEAAQILNKQWSSEGKMGGDSWSPDGLLGVQICIEHASGIVF